VEIPSSIYADQASSAIFFTASAYLQSRESGKMPARRQSSITSNESSQGSESQILASFAFSVHITTTEAQFDDAQYEDSVPDSRFPEDLVWDRISAWRSEVLREIGERLRLKYGGLVYPRMVELRSGSVTGSILLVLAASMSVYEFISKYKDFNDSLFVLRDQIETIINRSTRLIIGEEGPRAVPTVDVGVEIADVSVPTVPKRRPTLDLGGIASWPALLVGYLMVCNILLMLILTMITYRVTELLFPIVRGYVGH
jgi:hypothetical protein